MTNFVKTQGKEITETAINTLRETALNDFKTIYKNNKDNAIGIILDGVRDNIEIINQIITKLK